MASVYVPKQRVIERWNPKPKQPNQFCQKTKYENEQRFLCFAPTTNGKQYCEDCFKETLTGKDRKPPEAVAIEPMHWTNDKPRKRA
jgi:hypothetical protein